jgi:2-acylglycerol O-acyltransferase 2
LIDENLRESNPFFRLVCDWATSGKSRCASANKSTIKKAMTAGESLALIPGGFEDATVMEYGKERVATKNRKGFVKYCLEHGYQIIPVYTFGEGETYRTFTPLLKFRLWLNKFGVPALAFFGNPLCPVLPRTDASLLTYIGSPLVLPEIAAPTPQDVDAWHAKYLAALQDLFDEHKAEAGKSDARLEIW